VTLDKWPMTQTGQDARALTSWRALTDVTAGRPRWRTAENCRRVFTEHYTAHIARREQVTTDHWPVVSFTATHTRDTPVQGVLDTHLSGVNTSFVIFHWHTECYLAGRIGGHVPVTSLQPPFPRIG